MKNLIKKTKEVLGQNMNPLVDQEVSRLKKAGAINIITRFESDGFLPSDSIQMMAYGEPINPRTVIKYEEVEK